MVLIYLLRSTAKVMFLLCMSVHKGGGGPEGPNFFGGGTKFFPKLFPEGGGVAVPKV